MNIDLYRTYSDDDDIQAVSDIIKSGRDWADGPKVREFEGKLIEYLGRPGVLVCNSGTSALHMAMIACGVKHFHEVIVPSFTFVATANCVRFVGAKPIFADIETQTYGLDPQDVEKRITDKTVAIIAVHYGGSPCRIRELRAIAHKYRLILIEDAAEALGAMSGDIPIGSFGSCAVFSFCANKVISTGEGGALATDDKMIYNRALLVRSHGREAGSIDSSEAERYPVLGYNWRMPSMNAALGISQLAKIETIIKMRQKIAEQYCSELPKSGIILPKYAPEDKHVYQLFTIRILKKGRGFVHRHLLDNGIGCKIYFSPVHLTDYYRRWIWEPPRLPVTELVAREVLSLPIFPGLTVQEVSLVCQTVKEAMK